MLFPGMLNEIKNLFKLNTNKVSHHLLCTVMPVHVKEKGNKLKRNFTDLHIKIVLVC